MISALLLAVTLTLVPAHAADTPALYQASYEREAVADYAGALANIDALLAAGEDDYVVHLRRGWLLYLSGRYADSVVDYQAAATRDPASAEAVAGLSLPLMALRRWTEAERACKRLLELTPNNYLGLSRLAYVLYSSGRYAEAEAQYAAVLRLYPSDVEMRTGLGWAQLKQGKVSQARAAFSEVLRTAPGHTSSKEGLAAAK